MIAPDEYGPYRVLRVLGEGAMGVVYLADQTEPVRRQVALKVTKPGTNAQDVLARFEAERQALAAMDDPNIATVLDGGTSRSGLHYFVIEYVPGTPLTSYCDERRLSVQERLELFIPVCRAVAHAHEQGLIHRGLKPSSVLVTGDEEPRPKIIDFGVAGATERRLTRAIVQTESGDRAGTLAYLSPEQTEMTGLDVDARTDVYALGVILYEILVGALPFSEAELSGLSALYAVLEREPPSLPARFAGLGDRRVAIAAQRHTDVTRLTRWLRGDLESIVRKAMAKDRSRRYETAAGLALDLRRHLNNQPVLAHPAGVAYRTAKFARRHRSAVIVAAAALAAGAIVAVTVLV